MLLNRTAAADGSSNMLLLSADGCTRAQARLALGRPSGADAGSLSSVTRCSGALAPASG